MQAVMGHTLSSIWASPNVPLSIGDHMVFQSLRWEAPGVSRAMRKVLFFPSMAPWISIGYPPGLATMWCFEGLGWETPGVSRAMRKVLVFPGTAPWACLEVSFRIGDHVVFRRLGVGNTRCKSDHA